MVDEALKTELKLVDTSSLVDKVVERLVDLLQQKKLLLSLVRKKPLNNFSWGAY